MGSVGTQHSRAVWCRRTKMKIAFQSWPSQALEACCFCLRTPCRLQREPWVQAKGQAAATMQQCVETVDRWEETPYM